MKKIFISFALLVCTHMNAQNLADVQRFSQTPLNGSARFTAMGGAFGAVGGDFSALEINPAGSAIFAFSFPGRFVFDFIFDINSIYSSAAYNRSQKIRTKVQCQDFIFFFISIHLIVWI